MMIMERELEVESVGPNLNKALEIAIGNEILGEKELHSSRTGIVAGVEPALDAGAVVGDAGGQTDGRFHEVERNWATEVSGNSDEEIVLLDHGE